MKTIFDITIDFEKSHGSFLFDKKTNSEYLDFFSVFSSLPLGYNHSIFDRSFEKTISSISKIRMGNNLFASDELINFRNHFRKYVFSDYMHFTCTGALAVEAGLKCAMEYKKITKPMVLGIKKSFHGINSWGFITDRYQGTADRMENYPKNDWLNLSIEDVIKYIRDNRSGNIVAVIVEPIQCTSGDIYINTEKLLDLRNLCRAQDICFIVDEIQTGFGVTGKMWYSDHIGLDPDVLVFGKKSQICGIVAKEKYNECMITPLRKLDVTFDGELIDAVRATYILRAYEKYDLLDQAQINSKRFSLILKDKVLNYRSLGYLIAFDFESVEQRDSFAQQCYDRNLLCNKSADKTIRLRPNLAITEEEIDHFEKIIKQLI
jgi:L-lysine 6-transaminase